MNAALDSVFRSMMVDAFKQALQEDLVPLLKQAMPPEPPPKNAARPVQAELVLDVPQVAKQLNKNPATVRAWIHKGLLKASRPVGTARYEIRQRDVDAFVDGHQEPRTFATPAVDEEASRLLQKLNKGKR